MCQKVSIVAPFHLGLGSTTPNIDVPVQFVRLFLAVHCYYVTVCHLLDVWNMMLYYTSSVKERILFLHFPHCNDDL